MVRQELFSRLVDEAGRNQTLRAGLADARSAEEAAQVAAKCGFTISSADLQELRDCVHAVDELSEQQLAEVAGGFLGPDPDAMNFFGNAANGIAGGFKSLFGW